MHLAEPMTLITDFVLALLGLWFGWRLWHQGRDWDPRRWWATAFWAMALAALLGGSAHGFAPMLNGSSQALIWRATMVALGAAAVLLVYASIRTLGGQVLWAGLLGAEFGLYAVWVSWFDSDFFYAVLEYGTALLVVLVIHLGLMARRRPGAGAVVVGVGISFLAAWIQQAEISPSAVFNHNDLYHVVQMAGLFFLYRGAARVTATKPVEPT